MKLYRLFFPFLFSLGFALPSAAGQTPRDIIIAQLTPQKETVKSREVPVPKKDSQVSAVPALLPFYTSAQEYMKARRSQSMPQAVLKYKVTTQKLGEDMFSPAQLVTLTLGRDYASVASGDAVKIYDFKHNRLLSLRPEAKAAGEEEVGPVLFDNVSLYSRVFRNIKTVRRATQDGKLSAIPMGGGKKIDAFWIESAMSWTGRKGFDPKTMNVDFVDDGVRVTRKGRLIFTIDFIAHDEDTSALYQDYFKASFLRLAHYEWPIAPAILQALSDHQHMPMQSMEIVSYGPRALDGEKQIWDLQEHRVSMVNFSLPITALSVVDRTPLSPLVFIINEAVRGRALGGKPSTEQMESDFEAAGKRGDMMAQWLAGEKFNSHTGTCDAGMKTWLCAALVDIAAASINGSDQKLTDFIKGSKQAQSSVKRAAGAAMLKPYLADKDVPAIILRRAAMARANLKLGVARMAGVDTLSAESLLREALAKDPYDPNTYLGLAQVYAAGGAYEQSWDIYDALRAGISTPQSLILKIDTVEANLETTAPGYFLKD